MLVTSSVQSQNATVNIARRNLLLLLPVALVERAIGQVQAVAFRLVRRVGWEEMMGRNKCSIGDLYKTSPTFPVSHIGTKICNALELPYRNNESQISSIPLGDYRGFVRTDGPRGWRIELEGTGSRSNIQIHVGNRPSDSIGCILPGTGNATDASCSIAGSRDAMEAVKTATGANISVPVLLRIQV